MSRNKPIVVIKVGGSLLDRPDLSLWLSRYLGSQPEKRKVLVVGGGAMADHLRALDQIHGLGESKSHVLALAILEVTAQLLADLVPETCVVHRLAQLHGAWADGLTPILSPCKLLNADEILSRDFVLPRSWSVTTDSISAHLANLLGAESLLLLKRGIEPQGLTIRKSSILGVTDPLFPANARKLARVESYFFPDREAPTSTFLVIAPRLLSW